MQSKHAETYKTGLRTQKIRQHLEQNKTVYAVGGTCLGVGFIAGLLFGKRPVEVNVNIASI